MLLLSRGDVKKAVSMKEAIDAVEKAYAHYYLGKSTTPLRTRIHCDKANGDVLFMPAYMSDLGGLGIKIVSIFPNNARYQKPTISAVMMLNNAETGEPLALMDATYLTALRTGAASGVATRHLANKQVRKAALFGTGGQALKQLEAILVEREIGQIYVFDIDGKKAADFVALVKKQLARFDVEVMVAGTSGEAVHDADIIATATTSRNPVFSGGDIKPGVHINGIGSYTPDMQEVDEVTIKRADKIVVDSFEASFKEAGDFIIPMEKGILGPKDIYGEIGKITCGEIPGRESREEITFFKSVGIAIQDVAVARLVYDNALRNGLGQQVEIS